MNSRSNLPISARGRSRVEPTASRLRRTEKKLATANRRLARIKEEKRRAAVMRPIYRMVGLIGEVAQFHFEKGRE